MFSIRELKDFENKVTIFLSLDQSTIQLTADGDYVRVSNSGTSKSLRLGDLYDVARDSLKKILKDGTINVETVELSRTELEPPPEIQRIRCNAFTATFMDSEVTKKWLKLVEGPLETLSITTEVDKIRGIAQWDQVKKVGKELVVVACDIRDSELENLAAVSFALDSENITENGVRILLKKFLLTYSPGNAFQIRFKPSAGFCRSDLFKDLEDVQVSWNQGFRFELKSMDIASRRSTGLSIELDGFYFISGDYHLIKVLAPEGWRPS